MLIKERRIYFETFTVQNWVSVFLDFPMANDIVIDSLNYLSKYESMEIYAFVIMRDHMHLVWEIKDDEILSEIRSKFKSYTGRNIVKMLGNVDQEYLENFQSERQDRKHKFWKIGKYSYHLKHRDIVLQKIRYIHQNPLVGDYKSVDRVEEYRYSSARFYKFNDLHFKFLKRFV